MGRLAGSARARRSPGSDRVNRAMTQLGQTVGIFTTDAKLIIRSWDAWMASATGVPAGQARGRAIAALFPDLGPRGMIARFERVIAEGVVEVLAPKFHHYLIERR